MATRASVIAFLEESLKTEEVAVPIYAKHINNVLFFSSFDTEYQDRIKAMLEKLLNESERHKRIFSDLLERVKRESCDVY
jgi:rubrerythrin